MPQTDKTKLLQPTSIGGKQIKCHTQWIHTHHEFIQKSSAHATDATNRKKLLQPSSIGGKAKGNNLLV